MHRLVLRPYVAQSLIVATVLATSSSLYAQTTGTWLPTTGGNWSDPLNWNPAVPNGTSTLGGTATLGTSITADAAVNLDLPVTLSNLTFNSPFSYTLAGTSALTLNGNQRITVAQGTHTIGAPLAGINGFDKVGPGTLIINGNSTITGFIGVTAGSLRITNPAAIGSVSSDDVLGASSGGSLEITGSIDLGNRPIGLAGTPANGSLRSLAGNNRIGGNVFLLQNTNVGVDQNSTLTLDGQLLPNGVAFNTDFRKVGQGTLVAKRFGGADVLNAPQRPLGLLEVSGGLLRQQTNPSNGPTVATTSRVNALNIQPFAQLDLSNNAMLIDYFGSSPAVGIRQALSVTQIVSSASSPIGATGIGYADQTDVATLFPTATPNVFFGQSIDNTSLLMRYTLLGDTNLDGAVNFADLVNLARRFNQPGLWVNGDSNYDGQVNFTDLVNVARNFNRNLNGAPIEGGSGVNFDEQWSLALAQVPEPTVFGVVLSAGFALINRPRRKSEKSKSENKLVENQNA
jgi:autotransporter-associated beta strand protein